jgi:hypothetical protein
MEGCWLFILLALLNETVADDRLSVLGILWLFPAAFAINALLVRLRWPKICLWCVSWLIWLIAMLLIVKIQLAGSLAWSDKEWFLSIPRSITEVFYSFQPELLVLLFTAVIWWLGRRLSRLNLTFGALVTEFQFGLIMLILISLIASLLETDMINPVPVALTFFIFALIGMSVAHAMEGKSWLFGLNQGHWSGLLLISISVILILGLVISFIVTPEFLQILWDGIKWVGEFIWGVIRQIIDFFASLFSGSEPVEIEPMPSMPTMESGEVFELKMPEWLRRGLEIGWIILMVGIFLLALWRISSVIFRWLRRQLASAAGAEFEPMPGAFKADLLSFLKHILSKILSIRRLFYFKGRFAKANAEIATVIQIYRQFLRWGATGRHPRHVSQTPYEYCRVLTDILPEASEDLDLVTQQYVRARYGACLSTSDELNELRQALNRVKKIRLKRVNIKGIYDKEVTLGE